MKRYFFVFFFLFTVSGYAQLYPVFSQYYFNELMINPAYAGSHIQLSATATYRNQWINFPGSPKTFSFSAHSSLLKGRIGLGMMVNVDKIGSYANKDVTLAYAYRLQFPKATLSLGLQAMFYFLNADFSSLTLRTPDDPLFNSYNQFRPNIGAGIYYNRKNFFVGFSVPYLINSQFVNFEQVAAQLRQTRNYFLRSGFYSSLSKNVKINPSMLLRTQEGQPLSVDLNAAFIFYDVFSVGVSYRSEDAIISFVNLQLLENLFFSYSFDFTTSNLSPFSSGSQELMINYRTRINSIHKELACPSYYSYRER